MQSRRIWLLIWSLLICGWGECAHVAAQTQPRQQTPTAPRSTVERTAAPVRISADIGWDWQSTAENTQNLLLRGHCQISDGTRQYSADQAVIWITHLDRLANRDRVQIFLLGDVELQEEGTTRTAPEHFATWTTGNELQFDIRRRTNVPNEQDAVYRRALERREQVLQRPVTPSADAKTKSTSPRTAGPDASYRPETTTENASPEIVFPDEKDAGQGRRLRLFSRSTVPFNAQTFRDTRTTPPEQVLVITGGVNLIIDGLEDFGTVDLRADNMVIWTQAVDDFDPQAVASFVQRRDAPLQVFLEGNVIVLQKRNAGESGRSIFTGTTWTRAQRAFFDVRESRAIMQQVETKIQAPGLKSYIRIRADEVRQLSQSKFEAENADVTTSQFGKPGYKISAGEVQYEERQQSGLIQAHHEINPLNPDGSGGGDPITTPWITAVNPTFQVEDVPLFWWPRLSAPARMTTTPLRQVTVENDRIFGGQLRTRWDLPKLFGKQAPDGTDFEMLADALSRRGPALGLNSRWDLDTPAGRAQGQSQIYGLHDDGTDNLGLDRRSLDPNDPWRGRATIRHKQDLDDDFTFFGEFSAISDRNFLEQFFEQEWDTGKDQETLLGLKKQDGIFAGTLLGRVRLNDFDTTTNWLPKADVYALGGSLWNGRVNWSSHSSIGYGHLLPAAAPTDPNDVFTPLPFVADREGLVAMSRHELSAPLQVGPMKVVPYALGDVAFWGQDMSGNDLMRAYGSAGVRGAIFFTKAMPNVQNSVLGLRGLVHKMTLDFDYSYSDSSQPLGDIPQYNEFDEQAQLRFRNRLVTNTFGGTLPAEFDPRMYAVRSGAARNVTASFYELVDTQQVLRMGWRHRLQTQDGPIDNPRWRDWMTLDLEASFFPNPGRDNFGEAFGLLNANYAWNFSERTSLLANAAYDMFDNAQQLWNVGLLSQRGERGSLYVGLRQIKGAGLDSQILTASYSYQMHEKWVSTFGTAWDIGEHRNRGQSLTVTRVGADWLIHFGANYDASKNNAGVMLMVEPRFLPSSSSRFAGVPSSPQLGPLGGNY